MAVKTGTEKGSVASKFVKMCMWKLALLKQRIQNRAHLIEFMKTPLVNGTPPPG